MLRVSILAVLLGCRPTPQSSPAPPSPSPVAVWPSLPAATLPITTDDRDADGINDARDRCPDEPEDIDQFEDDDGCVDRDNDGDGVLDAYKLVDGHWTNCDRKLEDGVERDCRNLPEDSHGVGDRDGCPEAGCLDQCPSRIADSLEFDARGHFDATAASRFAEVADLLQRAPNTHIWIEIHINLRTTSKEALRLGERITSAARAELLRRGAPPENVRPRPGDQMLPLAPFAYNTFTAGRASFGRVEFTIMRYRGCCGAAPPDPPDPPEHQQCR